MTRARGRGVAAVNYPTGMNLGGDPSQALVHATTTGNFVVTLSSVDLGQGLKTVMAQICAETIGVPVEDVMSTPPTPTPARTAWAPSPRAARTASATPSMAAARGTRRDAGGRGGGARGRRRRSRDRRQGQHPRQGRAAAVDLDQGRALAAHFKHGRTISGRGMFLVPRSYPEPETGEMTPATCYAHACTVAEVEVDDETGEVAVVR